MNFGGMFGAAIGGDAGRMLEGLKQLFLSKKFLTALFTVAANIALYFGWEVDVEQAVALTSPLLTSILGQAAVDISKNNGGGSGTSTGTGILGGGPQPPTKSLAISILFAITFGLSATTAGLALTGCSSLRDSGKRMAVDAYDCSKAEAKQLATELAPTFLEVLEGALDNTGKLDPLPVRAVASSLTSAATRCAFRVAVAELTRPKSRDPNAPQSAELAIDSTQVNAIFEGIRADFYGGARFRFENGLQ